MEILSPIESVFFCPQITQIFKRMNYEISRKVIGCAMAVHRELGSGFLEGMYENALAIELKQNGLEYKRQVPLLVHYHHELIGRYKADFIVNNDLLLELKALQSTTDNSKSQLLNYLKATGIPAGLILNFGSKSLEFYRMAMTSKNQLPQ